MPEQTQPQGAVEQAAPSVEDRMERFLTQYDEEQQNPRTETEQAEPGRRQPKVAEQPESQAPSDELTSEDLPEVETEVIDGQPEVDAFEIVHNGTQKKLNREETIKLAQQGFDYTQKTQAVAETQRQLAERLKRVEILEQMQPMLAQDLAQVQAVEAQLKPYEAVDWVALANQDVNEYAKHRAHYDALVKTFNGAVNNLNQKRSAVAEARQKFTREHVEQEQKRLLERIPAWKDPEKYKTGASELREYLIGRGATPEGVDSLSDAVAVEVAYKAMQYDRLLKAKTDKVKQLRTAPPVTRPGTYQATAKADKDQALESRFKKTGDMKDAAALLLNRWK